ncbi:DNA adenine methylase [bacterium]|nr:DNA adenine methylase [bacterium]
MPRKENYPGHRLHEISPYIGKIRPILARQLVQEYSRPGDWIWDPFCGSGTIPLEARLLGRHVIASDINPYACILTRAKLHAPCSEAACLNSMETLTSLVKMNEKKNENKAPDWVRDFFHGETLRETRILIAESLARRLYFIVGCMLGILHHQRPGFLSYPASHLVPYLRYKRFPRDVYPEAYEYRDPIPRLEAKIRRTLANPPPLRTTRFRVLQKSVINKYLPPRSIDTIITSPPYLDALDYARDNRLRLWFLGVEDFRIINQREIGNISTFSSDMAIILKTMADVLKIDGICVLVLGDVTRSKRFHDIPNIILNIVNNDANALVLEKHWSDAIPDKRRSRRNGKATKRERVMIFRKARGGNNG